MELLIRVADKISDDIYRNVKLTKRGHVIAVMPDGHDWGARELDNPDWRIIRITGIGAAEARALVAEEPGLEVNRMRQCRAFKLDLDDVRLPEDARAFIADDSRKIPVFTVSLSALRTVRKRLEPVADPDQLP